MSLTDSPTTSPTLLRLLGEANNDAAWRRFLAHYEPVIDAWSRGRGLQTADADDVRAAVVAGLHSALQSFEYDPAQRFRGYLRACVNNALRKFFADRGRKPGNYGAGGDHADRLTELPFPANPDDLAAALDESLSEDLRAMQGVVERVRAQLSADTWQAYRLTAIEGRPAAEVADELGKSVAAVYMAKSRVGKRLRQMGSQFPPRPDDVPNER